MNYNQEINLSNIKKFRKVDIFYHTNEEKFNCVICERKVAIDGSTSIMGHYLICNNCAFEKFGDYAKAREWQQQKLKEEV